MNSTNVYLKNKNQREITRAQFANRLTQIMIDKGKRSARAARGADPKFLASIAPCSIVMARRYLLGQSIPDESILKNISSWANVDPNWLLYGDNNTNITVNEQICFDKVLLITIFNQLKPYLTGQINDKKFEDYIEFAIEIYETINPLELDFENKVKMITLMTKSISISYAETTILNDNNLSKACG